MERNARPSMRSENTKRQISEDIESKCSEKIFSYPNKII